MTEKQQFRENSELQMLQWALIEPICKFQIQFFKIIWHKTDFTSLCNDFEKLLKVASLIPRLRGRACSTQWSTSSTLFSYLIQ